MPRRNQGRQSLRTLLNGLFHRDDRRRRSQANALERRTAGSVESLEVRSLLSAANWVEGDVLVTVQSQEAVTRLQTTYPSAELRPLGDYGIYLLRLKNGLSTESAITDIREMPGVKYAEPNWVGEWTAIPNDPDFNRLWGLRNIGQVVNGTGGTFDADIDANQAWDTSTGASNRIVAIVDSGMDYTHPDLAANMWVNAGEIPGNGVDDDGNGFVDDVNGYDTADNDPDPRDFVGHGTHVGGTAGAVGNNGIGSTGVNWDVQLMALKIGSDLGGPTTAGAVAAINYAVQMGATVSNHSYTVTPTQALEDAIINAQANNHIVVVAAGNSASNTDILPSYPASYPQDNIIAVSATTQSDGLANFSSYGPTTVDIGAPGVNIWSTTPEAGSAFYGPDYDFSDGTSMASPHVTGAVAFLQGLAPTASYSTIIGALYQGADPLPSLAGRVSTGARLNLNGAIPFLSPARLTINPGSVLENAGTAGAFVTITKSAAPINQALTVDLFFDDNTEVDVPAIAVSNSVTIPAGVLSRTFAIDIIDDTLLDGPQVVTFDLQIAGASIDTEILTVLDHETIDVSFGASTIREDAGPAATHLTVTRSNTDVAAPNIWVTAANELREYDSAGTLINAFPVPWPFGPRPAGEDVHDVQVLQDGRVAVYNGTNNARLSVYTPVADTWQHYPVNGLSTNPADASTGGLGSLNNFVFLTDTGVGGNPYGAVRLDLSNGQVTRFATQSLGDRLFVKDIFDTRILEVDPITGVTVNSLPMPTSNTFGFNTGLAFDGTDLWVLAGPIGNDAIYRLNANNGTILDVHQLGGATEWDGLAWLNGQLYVQDSFIQNQITVYDPVLRRVVRTIDVGTISGVDISGGLAAITGPDALIATSTFGDEIYEINPKTGALNYVFNSGMGTTEYGVAVLSGEIYVGQFQGTDLNVFNRTGVLQRTVPLSLTGVPGVFGLGGDDIQGIKPTSYRYRDLSVGLDGQVYVLDQQGTAIGRFDATTLQPTVGRDGFFTLSRAVNGIAVDSTGRIFGAGVDGLVYEFDIDGGVVNFADPGMGELTDIDVNIGGAIHVTSRSGSVVTTDTALASFAGFTAGVADVFVSFGKHNSLPSGQAIVTLTNSDPTEISLAGQVVIPVGQQTVVIPVDAVDDNILDGTQRALVTAASAGYVGTSDSIDVTDVETIGVDIAPTEIPEDAGPAATQARIYRTNVDGPFGYVSSQSLANNTSATILDRDTINSFITVPSQTSRIQDLDLQITLTHSWIADLDVFLISPAGTRVELFTDLLTNESQMTGTILDDQAGIGIIDGSAPFTGRFMPEGSLADFNGENPSGQWRLEITDDNRSDFGQLISWSLTMQTIGSEATVVQLLSSDTTEATIIGQVTIPANQSEVFVDLNAIDDTILDGAQLVTIAVVDASALNFELGSDDVLITDVETMTFTVTDTKVSEAGGNAVSTGRVTRFNTDISGPYTVFLSSSDTSELVVPPSVTIPAGQMYAEFSIDAIDDAIFDGTQLVTITASAPDYGPDMTIDIEVEDLEPSLRFSTQSTSVFENSVTFTMTVTRVDQSDLSQPQLVNLISSDTTELTVPAQVSIPANSDSVNFVVTVVDDLLLDGTQQVSVLGTGAGIASGEILIDVLDHETLTLTVVRDSFYENARENQTAGFIMTGTVTRSNTGDLSQPLVVTLVSSDTTEVTVPATVTIPAGLASTTFTMVPVDDPSLDGPQLVTLSASAAGFVTGTRDVTVLDHEPPVIIGPPATTTNPNPTIQWQPIAGATRYDLWLDNLSTGINQILRDTNVLGTTYTPTEQLGIGDYRAWVRAYDSLEQPGFWSKAWFFRVNTPGTITEPSNAGSLAYPTFPRISWKSLADVSFYDLWVDNATTSTQQVVRIKNLTTTTYLSPGGLGSGTYRAWVRGINSAGLPGLWSPATTFTVLAAPVISNPSGGTFDRTPTFTWNAISGATHYDLWVSDLTHGVLEYRNLYVPTNTYDLTYDLDGGHYAAWVRALSGSKYSEWSAVSTFQVASPPTISSPAAGETTSANPTFVWSTVNDAARYELWVSRLDGSGQRVIYERFLQTTSYTAGGALVAGNYRVWVRAISNMGEATNWSRSVDFTVAAVESPIRPFASDSDGEVLLTAVERILAPGAADRAVSVMPGAEAPQAAPAAEQAGVASGKPVGVAADSDADAGLRDEVLAAWDLSDWWNDDAAEMQVAVDPAGAATVTGRPNRDRARSAARI